MGYAFINLKYKINIIEFYEYFHNSTWDLFKSKKVTYFIIQICEIKYARIQGKDELEKHFKISNIFNNQNNNKTNLFSQNKLNVIEQLVSKQKSVKINIF